MAESQISIETAETADEYGRREDCFVDHRGSPFSLKACIAHLQESLQQTGKDGMIDLPGLPEFSLPKSCPIEDSMDSHEDQVKAFLEIPQDLPVDIPPIISRTVICGDLFVPVPLDLESDPETDVQEYLQQVSEKRFCPPLKWRLPLVSVRAEMDEALSFPSHSNRLRALLRREAECESLMSSDGALALEEEVHRSTRSAQLREYLDDMFCHTYPEPITPPPLSPISEDVPTFIPGDAANVIDLTSEPSSPVRNRQLEKGSKDACHDSDPVAPLSLLTSSPSQFLPKPLDSQWGCESTRIEVPIIVSSSETPCEKDALENALPSLPSGDDSLNCSKTEGTNRDAFLGLVNNYGTYAKNMAAQEVLHPCDSVSRMPVPILDFEIASPEWSMKQLSAKSHFGWLKENMGGSFDTPLVPNDARSQRNLDWGPIPQMQGDVFLNEEVTNPVELSVEKKTPLEKDMAILQSTEDDNVEVVEILSDDEIPLQSPPQSSGKDGEKPDRALKRQAEPGLAEQDWSALLGSIRKGRVDGMSLLPRFNDSSATSSLVSGFMRLRGKKPRHEPPVHREKISPSQSQSHTSGNKQVSLALEVTKVPALAPEARLPERDSQGSFILSLSLGRTIIKHLESDWPSDKLVDMDHSRHSRLGDTDHISDLSFEADLTLSPSAGIIVTNLLTARQRALPGSTSLPPLRERIQKVSAKYERLIVLVSESNPLGEFMGKLAASDAAAYADFVSFAVSVEADVRVCLVPGAEGTLAKWILHLMCEHSQQAVSAERFLSGRETPWELLLRQAGMNVTAAKMLSGLLMENAGPSGLAQFLVTPVEERISLFAAALGGEKVLRSISKKLDRGWKT